MPMVEFSRYFQGIDSVEGWLIPTTAIISNELMRFQTASKISGNVCEIGVHHGRYFIALATGLMPSERGVAIDLFEDQHENIDNSGHGNRAVFEHHVSRFLNPNCIVVMKANSTRLEPSEIIRHGDVRFFSIDGGHTESITENDLRLAEKCISADGVVAVDDIINVSWTGVLGGVARYLQRDAGLVAFAMPPQKLLLCRPGRVEFYRNYLRNAFSGAIHKLDAEFLGQSIDIYEQLPAHLIAHYIPATVDGLRDENKQLQAESTKLREEKVALLDEIANLRRETEMLQTVTAASEERAADLQRQASDLQTHLKVVYASKRFRFGSQVAGVFNALKRG